MYSEWASLQHEIQCDKANQSVLHKYPEAVGKEVACSVVKHIAKNFSVSVINADLSSLENDRDIKWTMEVLCFGLSLPLTEHDAIRDCVNIYCEWLSALTKPSEFVPKPLIDNPNHYAQEIIHHLLNLFVPRAGSGVDLVKRQALLCHRVLRTIETISADSSILTRDMWETFLKFLLAANDSLLSPPAEKADIGDHLCERVLSVLFKMWLLACARCFPSPSLWKTFRNMSIYWRHHEALVHQWHRVNHALTSRLLKFMQGSDYPELHILDEDAQLIPTEMTNDCIAQSWFRFLHILQNPVDLCHPEIISQTPKFMHMALASECVIDPSQHECLKKLPLIFFKAMKGVSVMVNAFLGIPQSIKNTATNSGESAPRYSSASTPPGQRKPATRPFSAVAGQLAPKDKTSSKASSSTTAKLAAPTPLIAPGQLLLEPSLSLSPSRPKCNSILHLFGTWLFEAGLAGVKLHACHTENAKTDRRTNSFTETRHSSLSLDYHPVKIRVGDNTYEAGRAEACGTLCRIFCAHRTGEDILPVYYARFYIIMYYGLQTNESISGQVLSSILFNSCDLLRVDLAGVQILVPYILNALEMVLIDHIPKFKASDHIPIVELRKACVHLLLSILCLPLHFRDLEIQDILSNSEASENCLSFISLKIKINDLLLRALLVEADAANTQMLLGGLMLLIQDMALCEEAEHTAIQPQDTCSNDSEISDFSKVGTAASSSSDIMYQETYQKLHQQNYETAFDMFGKATSLVCNRLMASWRSDLNTALAAMELLSGLAKVHVRPPNRIMSKRTVKWICDFVVYQCSRPATSHSRDLHSMIVAAFKCLKLWLVEHSCLLYDKECLHYVLEVVELGISGSKSQKKAGDSQMVKLKLDKESKSAAMKNRTSDPPKFKGEKQLKPASMRVKDAAEEVLTCIIDQVGAFPPPCGPESLFSLLDERALLKYAKGSALPEHGSPFRYFVLDNSIVLGLLEQPLGNVGDLLPTVTAIVRGPFGRHAWTMQLRHQPRNQKVSSKAHLNNPPRPKPQENVGTCHNVKHRYFPEIVEKIPLTKLELSIPSIESLVTEKDAPELEKMKGFIEAQTMFENKVSQRAREELYRRTYPDPETECKPPRNCHEFQTARLFLSHYGFLSLEALRESTNSSIPPALVMLDSNNSALFSHLETLDGIPSRDSDTVHIFYMKPGQKCAQDILNNVMVSSNVQPQFLEFLRSLGWPVFVRKHAGWTGHVNSSWKVMDMEEMDDDDYLTGTGGSVYNGKQQVLYWADVSSEVAFIVPSLDSCRQRSSSSITDPGTDKTQSTVHSERVAAADMSLNKPKSLGLESDKGVKEKDSPGSPPEVTVPRGRKFGRHSALGIGADTRVFVVWLESFEDYENFPAVDLLGVTGTGLEQFVNTSSSSSVQKAQETYIIYIHALQNGLFRIHMQGQTGKVAMAIPLVDGTVVSRRSLGCLVRQTAINICRRKRLESESYQPPHVRRKLKIQDIVKRYRSKMTAPEFYAALFQDLPK